MRHYLRISRQVCAFVPFAPVIGRLPSRIFCPAAILFYVDFGKWIYFQYVLSFVFQNRVYPTLCFQYVLSFVLPVALATLSDLKSL